MSTNSRHGYEEIEIFVTNKSRGVMTGGSAVIILVVGMILFFMGGFMMLMFWVTGLLDVAPSFVIFIPGSILGIGLILSLFGFISAGRKPTPNQLKSTKNTKYREILTYGKIIDAKIDDVYENYGYTMNGIPQTTFYLDIGFERLKLTTFDRFIVPRYKHQKNMTLYYYSEYPDIIIPYDLVSPKRIYEQKREFYREVSL